MSDQTTDDTTVDDLAAAVADAARDQDRQVAVAESLTGGMVASALARAEEASTWFRGGLVAYASEVKHDVLDVRPGPVVSAEAARDMADGVARLLGAGATAAVTGAGGPDPQDGQPPGTVWVAVTVDGTTRAHGHRFEGDPPDVCRAATEATLRALLSGLNPGHPMV